MYNKLLIITIFCLGVVACTQSRKKNCNSVDNGQAKAEIFTATKKKYPSKTEILKELQGEWFCYKYVKNDTVEHLLMNMHLIGIMKILQKSFLNMPTLLFQTIH